MKIEGRLEETLMTDLREVNQNEQEALKIFSAMYVNSYEKIKNEKTESLQRAIESQIKYYGRKKDEFASRINQLSEKYVEMIDKVIEVYNTRFVTIISELSETWNNQKVAIVNAKIAIEQENDTRLQAAENKVNNYEIVIQECMKQMEECKIDMENRLNELFYNKDQSLTKGKISLFQKLSNLFSGKTKLERFVFQALEVELSNQEKVIEEQIVKIEEESIQKVAVIKDAQMQTQNIFKEMLEV